MTAVARARVEEALRGLEPVSLRRPVLCEIGSAGFLTLWELAVLERQVRACLARARTPTLLDLGCGAGGLGAYLASRLSVELLGVDASAAALRDAEDVAKRFGVRATLHQGTFEATQLADRAAAMVLSHDALYLAPEPAAALDEIRRVLIPGGWLSFTAYRCDEPRFDAVPGVRTDWERALRAAGLQVAARRDLSRRWRAVMGDKHRRRWQARDELRAALGAAVEPYLAVSAAMLGRDGRPSFLACTRRLLITARSPAGRGACA